MRRLQSGKNRLTVIAAATLVISMLPFSAARADDSGILAAIKADTGAILSRINQLPIMIQNIFITCDPLVTSCPKDLPKGNTSKIQDILNAVAFNIHDPGVPVLKSSDTLIRQIDNTAANLLAPVPASIAAPQNVMTQDLSNAALSAATLPFNPANLNNTANIQGDLGGLINSILLANYSYVSPITGLTNTSSQPKPIGYQILNDFFRNVGGRFDPKTGNINAPANVNDLTYQNIAIPGFTYCTDPACGSGDYAYNYILNASGMIIPHEAVTASWRNGGQPISATDPIHKYTVFYNTATSITTFNAYVLGRLYAEYQSSKNNQGYTQLQNKLIQDVSKPDWFTDVTSNESIGTVIRQMLIFNSQLFILMTQMLDTQRQALTAQTMTNTLLLLQNQSYEGSLVQNAK